MEVSGQLHDLATLHAAREPPVPIEQEAGGPQSLSGCFGEE
jgi:hypothetical protein